jgi:hypothetical protein
MQRIFKEHTGNMQGIFREHSVSQTSSRRVGGRFVSPSRKNISACDDTNIVCVM